MDWKIIAAWAYGFVAPLAIVGSLVLGISMIGGFVSLQEKFNLPLATVWSGVWLFAGIAILGGLTAFQIMK